MYLKMTDYDDRRKSDSNQPAKFYRNLDMNRYKNLAPVLKDSEETEPGQESFRAVNADSYETP